VQEEPLGKFANTKSARADVAIEELGLIIEVKYIRSSKDQERVVRDLIEDKSLYTKWTPLRHLVFLIYNANVLRDPEALQKMEGDMDFHGRKFHVYVVLCV